MNIELTKRAVKDFDKIERAQPRLYQALVKKIDVLANQPPLGKSLVGPLKGKWSLRVGDYRILYEFFETRLVVLTINHRREVYK